MAAYMVGNLPMRNVIYSILGQKLTRLISYVVFPIFAIVPLANCQPQPVPPAQSCDNTQSMSMRQVEIPPQTNNVSSHLNTKEVVLTFDDGPHPLRTQKVLDVLDKYCLKASFFLQGSNVKRHSDLVAQLLDQGHTVGSHTFNHANLTEKTIEGALAEIKRGHDVVSNALDGHPKADQTYFFRFPFVATSPELDTAVTDKGYSIITVDVDGADWTAITADDSANMIMQKLSEREDKGIVLLHDPFKHSEKRLELLIQKLINENYSIVHFVPAKN